MARSCSSFSLGTRTKASASRLPWTKRSSFKQSALVRQLPDRSLPAGFAHPTFADRSEEHTSELQSQSNLVCRLLLEKKKKNKIITTSYTQRPSDLQPSSVYQRD